MGAKEDELRELIREANATMKDLKTTMKEAREAKAELLQATEDHMNIVVVPKVEELLNGIGNMQQSLYEKISTQFDKLTSPMMKTLALSEQLDKLLERKIAEHS